MQQRDGAEYSAKLDYQPDRFKIVIHGNDDEEFERKLKKLHDKELIGDRTCVADMKDYQLILSLFGGYALSPSLATAIANLEKNGGPSIIPDAVLSAHDDRIRIVLPSYQSDLIAILQAVPDRSFDHSDKCWYVPRSSLRRLLENLQGFKLYTHKEIREDAKAIARDLADMQRKTQDNDAIAKAQAVELPYTFKIEPFLHQKVGIAFLINNEYAGLFDEQGLGKTQQLVCALDILRQRKVLHKTIVVCPNSVKYSWSREIALHTELDCAIVEGNRKQRDALWKDGAFFLVLNYELLRNDHNDIKTLLSTQPCALVFDESQKLKNRKAKTTKVAQLLSPLAKVRFLATGTPIGNRPEDLWSQISLLDQGRLLGSFSEFMEQHCEMGQQYRGWTSVKYKNLPVIKQKLRAISIRRRKDEVLDLPEKLYQKLHIELHHDQRRLYNQMRDDLYVIIRDMGDREVEQKAQNLLVQMLRLSQLASNPRLLDRNYHGSNAKFEELDGLLEDLLYDGEKAIVWTSYVENVRELGQRYQIWHPLAMYGEVRPEERANIVERFQKDPTHRLLVANPKTAREGFTLTAAKTAIYLDRTFNAIDYWQSQDRIHRIGQAGTCTIINVIARHTIDEYVDETLEQKRDYSTVSLGDDEDRNFVQLRLTKKKLLELLEADRTP